jgi:carbamoyl-phosphate synthase large subunit
MTEATGAPAVTMLLSSAGRRVELLDCFRAAAARLGIDLTVVAGDAEPDTSSACQLAAAAVRLPRCDDVGFVDGVLATCADHGVDLVVPTIDPELLPLAAAKERFSAAGVDLVVSEHDAVAVARDKARTALVLADALPVPATWRLDDAAAAGGVTFPAVVKPVDGSASTGVRVVHDAGGLPGNGHGLIAQQLLEGSEHTVNLYISRRGELVAAVPHRRIAVRGGEVSKGQVVLHPVLLDAAATVVRLIPGLRGAICFQAFLVGDRLEGVFEINARFGGGYPLADAAGAPFAEWVLREHLGLPLPDDVTVQDGLTMLRFDRSVFVAPR